MAADKIADRVMDAIKSDSNFDMKKLFDPLVSIDVACEYMDCSRKYFDTHYLSDPDFPRHMKGREAQFRISWLSDWVNKHS
jgi:hypothetical protein